MSELTILDLFPSVVTYKILSYFTPQELCRYIAPVCQRWSEFAYDPILWQNLSFDFNQVFNLSKLECILSRAPLLKSLCLHRKSELSIAEIDLVSSLCPMLRHIDIGFCSNLNNRVLTNLVACCPHITSFNAEGCKGIESTCVEEMLRWPKLCKINLSHCMHITDENVMNIASTVPQLEYFNIDGIAWITDRSVILLAQRQCQWLQHLILDGAQLTDDSIEALALCHNLKELKISFAELISDRALDYIQALRKLRLLCIRHAIELSSERLSSLFYSPSLRNLEVLNLSDCTNLDDNVLRALSECCLNLKSLSLEWCWNISDTGLEYILQTCRHLESLDLLGLCQISGNCLQNIPTCLPNLLYLNLRECNQICDDIISEVVQQKPNLYVLNYYGERLT